MTDGDGAPIHRKLPKLLVLYGLAVLVATGMFAASDTARPPYVGWKIEVAAGVITVTTFAGLAYWEWYR